MADPHESITFGRSLSLRVDGAIGAMSLSPNGRDAVLAGRRGLFIIDLDDPFTTPRWLHHITSWEVADVQWSPHHNAKPSWCILTSNQKALLWDLSRPSNNAILNVLHKHTRAITDINFHPHDPELLATCSIDTFVYGWDMRCPRRPVSQWAEWRAGATQVKWNHGNPFEIASLHDNAFYIWDTRKGALPVIKVNDAHKGKINGLDFSGGSRNIITCSNDKTVKFWNLTTEKSKSFISEFDYFDKTNTIDTVVNNELSDKLSPSVVIHTDFPVARARNLPFGTDMACGIMPIRGGNDSIKIVNYDAAHKQSMETNEPIELECNPIYSFKGHQGNIKDFLWRTRQELYEGVLKSHKDFQLVTWSSQDYDLKLWPHTNELYKSVNYDPTHQNLFSEQGSGTATPTVTPTPTPPTTPGIDSVYKYDTYCIEPPVTIDDLTKGNKNDLLSSMTMYQLLKRNNKQIHGGGQLNHLDWISGVRIGKEDEMTKNSTSIANSSDDSAAVISESKKDLSDGPSNLGEEVSYVGHKFPKIRFEKISVSTGELIISLRGPVISVVGKDDSISETEKETIQSEVDDDKETTNSTIAVAANTSTVAANITTTTTATTATTGNNNIPSAIANNNIEDDSKLVFIRMEIKFPKGYPHLEELPSSQSISTKQLLKLQKHNMIKFNIEETHELTLSIKKKMLETLNDISQFYTNKYQRFCLEPCLRFLMGDKIELSDSLFLDHEDEDMLSDEDEEDDIETDGVQIGSEDWADDLINQQPDMIPVHDDGNDDVEREIDDAIDDDDFEDFDLIPAIQEDTMKGSTESLKKNYSLNANNSNGGLEKGMVMNPQVFDSTPVPKGCGAVWSHTGQLVCFFIPKESNDGEEVESKTLQKFNIFKFSNGGFSLNADKQQNHHHHHHQNHHHHNQNHHINQTFDENMDMDSIEVSSEDITDDSEGFDSYSDSESGSYSESGSDSESNSSDDSFTNDWDDILQDDVPSRTRIPGLFKTSVGLGNRYVTRGAGSGAGTGSGTGTGMGGGRSFLRRLHSNGGTSNRHSSIHGTSGAGSLKKSRKRKGRSGRKNNKNIVGIFDLRHLIPDKYELACEYRVLGDSPEKLAKYNAEIAFKYGLKEIGDVWKILEMILIKDVEINDINPVYYAPDGGSNKIEVLNQLIMNSGVIKRVMGGFDNDRSYRFYWGTHPFGHAWLIKKIFEYFEIRGNIQMLAMLSCILFENRNNIRKPPADVINVPIHTPYGALPPPPSVVALRNYSTSMAVTNGMPIHGGSSGKDSFEDQSYSNHGSISLQYDKFKNGSSTLVYNNPNPMSYHSYARSITSSIDGGSIKDGTSPDKVGVLRKSIQPGLGTFTSLNELALYNVEAELPRNKFISRRSTTMDKRRGGGISGVESKKQILATPNTPFIRSKARNPPIITLEMLNSDDLDLYDDVYTQSLLASQNEDKIRLYRDQYADILYLWGLPVSRIKILKFNYPEGVSDYKSPFDVHKGSFGVRNKIKKKNLDNPNIRFVSPITTSLIQPQAWNTAKVSALKYCNLCGLLVTKRLVLCNNCEHVLHADCAVEWWPSEDEEENDSIECPSGCGCTCLKYRI